MAAAVATIAIAEIKASQNQPVRCAASSPDSFCTRPRSRFSKNRTTTPQTALKSPKICGLARRTRSNPNMSTAHIMSGINHNKESSCCARSRPLNVSFAPAQLTWIHGRKKQTTTMMAALRLMRRITFTPPFLTTKTPRRILASISFCPLCPRWLCGYRHPRTN